MKHYVGAIDQGTTSTRFMVFDQAARVVAAAQKEHEQIFPRAGWVEHDALEIWRRTQEVIAAALSAGRLGPAALAAIGFAEDVSRFAVIRGQDRFRAKTGLPLSTYFSSLKLRWILQNVPGARERAAAGDTLFGNIDSWLLWNLTGGTRGGVHVTDVTNASRTQLLNLSTLDWDDELLAAFEIPRATLPRVCSSSEIYGSATLPLISGVPIAGDLGDQQAALVGQTCFQPGEVKNTYGTGCFLLMNTGERNVPSHFGLLTTIAYKFGKEKACCALEGSVAIAGALVQWLRDNLGLIEKSADIEALARTVNDNGGVYFVPAFSGLFAPYWKDTARGVIAGLTRYA